MSIRTSERELIYNKKGTTDLGIIGVRIFSIVHRKLDLRSTVSHGLEEDEVELMC